MMFVNFQRMNSLSEHCVPQLYMFCVLLCSVIISMYSFVHAPYNYIYGQLIFCLLGVSTKYSVTKLGDLNTTKPGNSYLTKSRDSYAFKQGDGYTTQPGNNYLTTSRDSYITKAGDGYTSSKLGDSHTTKSRHRFPTKSGVNYFSVTTAHHSIKNVIKSEGQCITYLLCLNSKCE